MEQKPPYKPITQKPYCCVPACISMILDRRNILHETQDEIGYELGLIVPKDKAHLFTKVRTGEKPVAGYGTQVDKEEYSINNYFKKNNINLKEKYFFVKDIPDVKDFIISNIKKNNDIMVCFNNKILYGSGDWGHVSLIQGIEKDTVFLVDPEKDVPKIRKVKLDKLISAIEYHGKEKRGGFWLISENSNSNFSKDEKNFS